MNERLMPKQLPIETDTRFEQVFHKDHRNCECAMPMLSRKWNDALGTFVAIRLCCLARAVEELTGQSLYQVFEFDPKWEWDCAKVEQREGPDGTFYEQAKGLPPRWLRERMQQKGIEIKNLGS